MSLLNNQLHGRHHSGRDTKRNRDGSSGDLEAYRRNSRTVSQPGAPSPATEISSGCEGAFDPLGPTGRKVSPASFPGTLKGVLNFQKSLMSKI